MATLNVAQGPLTDRVRVYDFVKAEIYQPYNRTAGTIQNSSGVALVAGAIQVGYPLVRISEGVWRTALAADSAGIHGFFIDERLHEPLIAGATTQSSYGILERGPAHVNTSAIPAKDVANGNFNINSIITAMGNFNAAIRKFVESPTSSVQTT